MAEPKNMGARHMSKTALYEPQRTNNFELQVLVPGYADTANTNITLAVASVDPPQVSINPIEIQYGNNSVKFAGKPEYQTSSITFNDFIGINSAKLLYDWFEKAYRTSDQTVGFAARYKCEGYLIEYSPDGSIYRTWNLHGCWLSQFAPGSLSQDGNSVQQVSGTLVYDWFDYGDNNASLAVDGYTGK